MVALGGDLGSPGSEILDLADQQQTSRTYMAEHTDRHEQHRGSAR